MSQTVKVTEYYVWHTDRPYALCFVDTPGLGDMAGIQQDVENKKKIAENICKTPYLTAIAFVVKANMNRLTDHSMYIVTAILE
jgi:hypothetical protein